MLVEGALITVIGAWQQEVSGDISSNTNGNRPVKDYQGQHTATSLRPSSQSNQGHMTAAVLFLCLLFLEGLAVVEREKQDQHALLGAGHWQPT